MVKKIDGNKPTGLPSAGKVEGGKAVEGTTLKGVGKVAPTEKKQGTAATQRSGHALTAANREEIYRRIKEEADKMFQAGQLPKKKREAVENAVRMAIDLGIVEHEDGEKPKK